jgi:hypothetical protein
VEIIMDDNNLIKEQPPPKKNRKKPIWPLVISSLKGSFPKERIKNVIKDMKDRDNQGLEKYGVRLQPYNGRDALVDAYQEVLDASVYLGQFIYEQTEPIDTRINNLFNDILSSIVTLREVIDERDRETKDEATDSKPAKE